MKRSRCMDSFRRSDHAEHKCFPQPSLTNRFAAIIIQTGVISRRLFVGLLRVISYNWVKQRPKTALQVYVNRIKFSDCARFVKIESGGLSANTRRICSLLVR